MPTTSDLVPQVLFLMDTAGTAVAYASKALFTAAGWNLSWQDNTGAALGSQPTWTLSAGDANGRHVVGFTPGLGAATVKITAPAGYRSDPAEFAVEATTYSVDSLYGVILASSGTVITPTTTSGEVDVYDGNSIVIDMSVLEAALSEIGAASLAACDSMSAQIKLTSKESEDAADVALSWTILSDVSGTRTVRAYIDAFPAALAILDDAKTLDCRCDLRLTKGTKTVTAAIRNVTVRWKANT